MNSIKLQQKAEELCAKIDREILRCRLFLEDDGVELSTFIADLNRKEKLTREAEFIAADLIQRSKQELELAGWIHYWGCFENKLVHFVPFSAAPELSSYLVFKYGSKKDVGLSDAVHHVFRKEKITDVSPSGFLDYLLKARKNDDALKEHISNSRPPRIEKDCLDLLRIYLVSYYEDMDYSETAVNNHQISQKIKNIRAGWKKNISLKPPEEQDTENRLYFNIFRTIRDSPPDRVFPVEQALEIYLGPPKNEDDGRRINLLQHLLQCHQKLYSLAQCPDRSRIETWTITRENIPRLFKRMSEWELLDRQKSFGPSKDALSLMEESEKIY